MSSNPFDKIPPHDEKAEAAVLGAMLIEPKCAGMAVELLTEHDFYQPAHVRAFKIFALHVNEGRALDSIIGSSALAGQGYSGDPDAGAYVEACPSAANIEEYIRILREKSRCRQGIERCARLLSHFQAGEADEAESAEREWLAEAKPHYESTWLGDEEIAMSIDEQVPWIWNGLIARDGLTLLHSKPKGGKSTLAYGLFACLAQGKPFLGRHTEACKVLYLSEEPKSAIREKLLRFEVPRGTMRFMLRKLVSRKPFEVYMREAAEEAVRFGAGLVVIDTVAAWAGLEEAQENDASVVEANMRTIRNTLPSSVAALAIHHSNRQGGLRGSSAFEGAADVILCLNKNEESTDRRRWLKGVGRWDVVPECIEYSISERDTFVLAQKDDAAREYAGVYSAILNEPRQLEDIMHVVDGRRHYVTKALNELEQAGYIVRSGKGLRGDPKMWRRSAAAERAKDEGVLAQLR